MKSLVVYSTQTGNTHKVAQAIFEILPSLKEIHPTSSAPAPDGYDLIAIGFWVDKGQPDKMSREYMQKIQGATLGLFGTLGAQPESEHGRGSLRRAVDLVSGKNYIAGTFLCQGRIDPAVIKMMQKTAADHHPMTPERIARIQAAESHPDKTDLKNAQSIFQDIVQTVQKKVPRCAE
ncbi:MAG: flavodoxin family protein [Pseudomonadota bacterium]